MLAYVKYCSITKFIAKLRATEDMLKSQQAASLSQAFDGSKLDV